MQIQKLLQSDENRAVSPVIGVILMVAITVILAAVIGTFVLGLGDQVQETAPNAQFSFDYNPSAATGEELTITHDGGDAIPADQLEVNGDTVEAWDGTGRVSAGDSHTTGASDTSTVRVVWTSEGGGQSSTVARWSGPDA